MRRLCILLALLLLLGSLAGCASGAAPKQPDGAQREDVPEEDTSVPEEPDTDVPEPEGGESAGPGPGETAPVPAPEAIVLQDFTVETVDGGTFTLSEAMKDHELVLINLFATWCGPCRMEFPYMQEALDQRSGSVAAVVLSVDPGDTGDMLRDYVQETGLTLPVASGAGLDVADYAAEAIPTTLLVDRTGRLAGVEVGAKTSAQEFLDLFDGFTGEDYDPGTAVYTVYVYDIATQQMIPGAVVNFCTDTACTPVTADGDGAAVFTGPPARYHVQIISVPEGMQPYYGDEFTTEPYGQTFYVPYMEAER